jgi:signal transduction histidine kinase
MQDKGWVLDPWHLRTAQRVAELAQQEKDPAEFARKVRIIESDEELNIRLYLPVDKPYSGSYQVLDPAGRLLFRTASAPGMPLASKGPGFHQDRLNGENYWVAEVWTEDGKVRVLVAESIRWRRATSVYQGKAYLKVYLWLILAAPLVTWLSSRRAINPLKSLVRLVKSRKPGDFSPIRPEHEVVEVQPLIDASNHLLLQVEDILGAQRRFLADAAHELRTPLAVVATQAHAMIGEEDKARRELYAQDLELGIERANNMVRQLLAVARLEGLDPESVGAPIELAALARERILFVLPLAIKKTQDLGAEGPDTLESFGNVSALGSALDNLLENAIRYTPPGGRITLRYGGLDSGVFLEVEDNGPGMSEAFKARAFERFSRERGNHPDGAGLGLAIVHRVVELHHGRVQLLDPIQGQGLRVRVELPSRADHSGFDPQI